VARDDRIDHRIDAGDVAAVGLQPQRRHLMLRGFGGGGAGRGGVQIGGDQRRAGLGKGEGDGMADAAAGAGDERNLA
jgi:hypothetical protein